MANRSKDRPPIWIRRVGNVLMPVTMVDTQRVLTLPFGKDLRADFRMDRSPQFHRFYWMLLGKVVEATDKFGGSSDALHRWLKLKLGMIEEIRYFDGSTIMDLTSTRWLSMDQIEFREFYDRAVKLIIEEVLPGVPRSALIREVENMLGVSEESVWRKAA